MTAASRDGGFDNPASVTIQLCIVPVKAQNKYTHFSQKPETPRLLPYTNDGVIENPVLALFTYHVFRDYYTVYWQKWHFVTLYYVVNWF